MIEYMIEGRPFLFQGTEKTVYHVAETGVAVVGSWSSKEPIVALVDADKKNYELKTMLIDRSVQLIMASSPKGTDESWIKQATPTVSITKLVIDPWSYKELFLTGSVLELLYHSLLSLD